jgi:hypothetical protein
MWKEGSITDEHIQRQLPAKPTQGIVAVRFFLNPWLADDSLSRICLDLAYTFAPLVSVSKLLKTQFMEVGNVKRCQVGISFPLNFIQ